MTATAPAPVPILLYHSISPVAAPEFQPWAVPPEQFAAQIAYLCENGFTPLTVTQLVEARRSRRRPVKPVVVTFDDGFLDFHEEALPILREHGCSATVYIATDFVGGTSRWLAAIGEGDRPMMNARQVAELPAQGIEVGAHSRTHPQLDTIPLADAREEIAGSKRRLEQILGEGVQSFAYPHGYRTRAIRRLVEELGFSSACSVKDALSGDRDDPFDLARLIITPDTDIWTFGMLLRGEGVPVARRGDDWRVLGWRYARRMGKLIDELKARRRTDPGPPPSGRTPDYG